jgi:hypothetical protein
MEGSSSGSWLDTPNKIAKEPIKLLAVAAEIRLENLPNTSKKLRRSTQLAPSQLFRLEQLRPV